MSYSVTEEEAHDVLEYYENLILRSPYVKYIAVVKSDNIIRGYSLEIGVTRSDKIFPNNKLSAKNIYLGRFKEFEIPTSLPIPSIYKKVLSVSSEMSHAEVFFERKDNCFIRTIITNTNDYSLINDIVNKEHYYKIGKYDFIEKEREWKNYRYGGQPIKMYQNIEQTNFTQPGTLGCIFELLEFPGEIFGLSNWHVISGNKHKYGSKIFSHPDNKEIGELFWDNLNIHSEIGVFRLNDYCKNIFEKKFPNGVPKWRIIPPKIGMEVFHYGFGTEDENPGEVPQKKIRSINATVKVNQKFFRNRKRIFKNQILIEDFTKDGDSGSCVLTKENGSNIISIVGLNFSISQYSQTFGTYEYIDYSIANNLSLILNQLFDKKQEVYNFNSKDIDTGINNYLIDKFTLKNF